MRHISSLLLLILSFPADAQMRQGNAEREGISDDQEMPVQSANSVSPSEQIGRTADAGNGQIGERQRRDAGPSSTKPLARVDSRVANRIENRIRSRIDRYYDPRANATSPFKVAGDQARTAGTRSEDH